MAIKSKCQAELQGFTRKARLEKFYFEEIGIQKYEVIAKVLEIFLTLSHGQASVEHAFSYNNTVVQTNVSAESVISKRLMKDHMLFHKLKPYTIKITDPMADSKFTSEISAPSEEK